MVIVGLFEEVGWRGYALPRLQQRMTGLRAALLLGAVWAVWHLPELVSDPSGQRPVVQFVILVVAQSVVFSWIYNSTHASLPLVIISHATIDTVARFALPQFTGSDYQIIWWCQAALWTGLALLVAVTTRSSLNAAVPHRARNGEAGTAPRGRAGRRPGPRATGAAAAARRL